MAPPAYPAGLFSLLDLLHRFGHEVGHGPADLVIGLVDAGSVEILADLAENVLVAGFLEIGLDDLLGVGVRVRPGFPHEPGRPQAEQLVAARLGLEAKLGVMGEFLLKFVFAVVEGRHRIHLRTGGVGAVRRLLIYA